MPLPPIRQAARGPVFRHGLAALATTVLAGCLFADPLEYEETFTVASDAVLYNAFETVEQGDAAVWGSYPKGAYFFSTAPDFEAFYVALTGGSVAPEVDFGPYRVVAVVDADRTTAGYGVEVVAVENRAGDQYDVTARFTRPDGPAATVLTKPYHIVKVMVGIPAPGPG